MRHSSMYRSISTNRFSDDQFSYYSSSSPSAKVPTALRALSQSQELPVYEPLSEAAKKERTRSTFADKAVHAIPFVLLLCAFILWLSSNPDVDAKESSRGMTGHGELASDGTGHLPFHLHDPSRLRDINTMFSRNFS